MIAPRELKQNNLIRDIESGRIGSVLTMGTKKCTVKMPFSKLMQDYDDFEPIELTEEWLEKFGLKNSEIGYEVIVKQTKFSAIRAKGFFSVGLAGPFGLYLIKLKYVHQFQNLYSSVFLEELTIK